MRRRHTLVHDSHLDGGIVGVGVEVAVVKKLRSLLDANCGGRNCGLCGHMMARLLGLRYYLWLAFWDPHEGYSCLRLKLFALCLIAWTPTWKGRLGAQHVNPSYRVFHFLCFSFTRIPFNFSGCQLHNMLSHIESFLMLQTGFLTRSWYTPPITEDAIKEW